MKRRNLKRSYARQSVGINARRLATAATSVFSGLLALLVLAGQLVAEERQSGTAYVIVLHPQARVASGVIRLADVAAISGPNHSICERLGQLDIDDAPAAGEKRSISVLQVQFRLHLTGIQRSAYRVEGTTCAVHRSAVRQTSLVTPSGPQQQDVVQAVYDAASKTATNKNRDRLQSLLAQQLQKLAERSPQTIRPAGFESVRRPEPPGSLRRPTSSGVTQTVRGGAGTPISFAEAGGLEMAIHGPG